MPNATSIYCVKRGDLEIWPIMWLSSVRITKSFIYGNRYLTLRWRRNDRDASQITSLTIVYSTVYSDADQRKHQSSASLAFVRGIHRGPVNSPHKWPVTRKMFPFDDVIMTYQFLRCTRLQVNMNSIWRPKNIPISAHCEEICWFCALQEIILS